MFMFRLSSRSIRMLVFFSWLVAIALSAWVTAELITRLLTPEGVAASYRSVTDPRVAAQRLSTHAPMAVGVDNASGTSVAAARVSQSFELVGVATGFGTAPGFALVRATGGRVMPYMLGESIAPGVVLTALHPTHVEIERGAVRETIPLSRSTAGVASVPVTTGIPRAGNESVDTPARMPPKPRN